MHKSGETRPTAHTTLYHMYSIDYYSFGMKVSAHGDTGTVPSAGDAKRDARPNCLPNFRHILGFFTFKLPIYGHHRFYLTFTHDSPNYANTYCDIYIILPGYR